MDYKTLKSDQNFYIDPRNIERLNSRNILEYKVVEMEIGRVLRDLSYRNGGIVNLKDTFVYAYLSGTELGKKKYQEYCKICNVPFRNEKEYNTLISSLEANEYDIRKGAICIDQFSLILEGQHRACYLLHKYGPFHKVPLLQIRYKLGLNPIFFLRLAKAKICNYIYLTSQKNVRNKK